MEWILGLCTVLALAAAVVSWRAARTARAAAEDARAAAATAGALAAEVPHRAEPEPSAEVARPGPLALEPGSGVVWRVRNTTGDEVTIDGLHNAGDFVRKPFEVLPVVLPAHGAVDVTLVPVWGHPLPRAIEMVLSGSAAVVRLPIPSEAG